MVFKIFVIFLAFPFFITGQPIKPRNLRVDLLAKPDTALVQSISQYGITWTFNKKVRVGKFINGDFYVIGPVTITSIDPAPINGRNGSVIDLKLTGRTYTNAKAGWDSRIPNGRYDSTLRVYPPFELVPGKSVISTISVDSVGKIENMFRSGYYNDMITTATAAILTSLPARVDEDAFRPGYADPGKKFYYRRFVRDSLLPRLLAVDKTPAISKFEPFFEKIWVETGYDEYTSAIRNMPVYGREYARILAHATLMLCLDYPLKEKEKLLIGILQLGIDIRGLLEAGYQGWPAVGGHGNGRKLPLLFTGFMFNDSEMMNPDLNYPDANFSEDLQTMYDSCWTGAKVVFAGHAGKDGYPGKADWGRYEHLHPSKWPGTTGESYRRCCTSIAWVGEALAARLLGVEKIWNHPPFFDYVERWMTEDDSAFVRIIKEETGKDFSASHNRQKQAWDTFIENMYKKYWLLKK